MEWMRRFRVRSSFVVVGTVLVSSLAAMAGMMLAGSSTVTDIMHRNKRANVDITRARCLSLCNDADDIRPPLPPSSLINGFHEGSLRARLPYVGGFGSGAVNHLNMFAHVAPFSGTRIVAASSAADTETE